VKEVAQTVGLCRATIDNLVKKGMFPPSRRISTGRVGWLAYARKAIMDGTKV